MTFRVFDDSTQGAYFVVLIFSAIATVVAVVLRFVATRLTHRKLALEDWFALAAVLVFLLRVGIVLYCLTVINGRGLELAFDTAAYTKAFKMIYVADLITALDQTLAKFSICALYYRIFGVNRTYVRWIWFIAAIQGLTYITILFWSIFQCNPIHKFWQWWAAGYCFRTAVILVILEPINSIVDFALVILAMFMIRSLQIARRTKWKLRFLFGLGSLAGIFGFIKMGVAYSPNVAYSTASLGLWAAVQSLAVIVCSCAPVFKPILPQSGLWSRLTSKISNISLRSGQQKTTATGSGSPNTKPSSETGTGSQRSQRYLPLDGSSTHVQAGTEPQAWNDRSDGEHMGVNTYPLGSIQVKRSVYVV